MRETVFLISQKRYFCREGLDNVKNRRQSLSKQTSIARLRFFVNPFFVNHRENAAVYYTLLREWCAVFYDCWEVMPFANRLI